MKVYVVSRSANRYFAMTPENIVAVHGYSVGKSPRDAAEGSAVEHTKATGEHTYLYEVDVQVPVAGYKVEKKVVEFDPSE